MFRQLREQFLPNKKHTSFGEFDNMESFCTVDFIVKTLMIYNSVVLEASCIILSYIVVSSLLKTVDHNSFVMFFM